MDVTLEFVQETPAKLQGELVGSQSGSGFGLGSEDLKLKSWFESLEREEEAAAEDAEEEEGFREREMRRRRRQRNLRLIEVLGVTVILLELRKITTSRLFPSF